MKDIPFFTTQFGVASLVFKQIPYNGIAYVTIHDCADLQVLLKECTDFCRAVGAAAVIATGNDGLSEYPLYTSVLKMRCSREQLPDTDAKLFPVQAKTLARFRDIYNEAMKHVCNASYMSYEDAEKVLSEGNGYFVHRDQVLLGIGIADGERINAVVSLIQGCGKDVLLALNHALSGMCVEVEVASENTRAVRLYEKLGFVCCCELSKWYKIF